MTAFVARARRPVVLTGALALAVVTACTSDDDKLGAPTGVPATGAGGDGGAAPPSSPSASSGEAAVRSRKCGDCHGANLAGTVTKLPGYPDGVELFAPNLTPDQATGIGTWTDGQLRLAIREGVDKEGLVLCPQMQHYRTMPDSEVDAIIQYLRSIPPVAKAVRESICPPLKR